MKKLLFLALVVSIFGVLFFGLNTIQNDSNDIDRLRQSLLPIKKILNKENLISIVANRNDKALHYRTQFILTPTIVDLYSPDHDTLLFIQKKGKKKVLLPEVKYDTLYAAEDEKYDFLLLSKNKTR